MRASYQSHQLVFKKPSGTSRGVMTNKPTWFLKLWDEENPTIIGIGECSPLPGLSIDNLENFEAKLQAVCKSLEDDCPLPDGIAYYPSIVFGIEQALLDLANGGQQILFPSAFTEGEDAIIINGLIWMGSKSDMLQQINEKLDKGFRCLKLKIGSLDFETELGILQYIRQQYSESNLTLRVDANGAFSPQEALDKLNRLAALHIHSIEQPVKAGQWQEMAALCKATPIPIALDEELIGIQDSIEMYKLLESIQPQYIILKPSLLGGFGKGKKWIGLANQMGIGWWITSALESNVGLNAIAQWTYTLRNTLPQGLGTGQLYRNNLPSKLDLKGEKLWYRA
ncbi:MAG: o-succinylbenzoate synthase [Chitinophagales bacterium]|nr:o-succinylbenzoate synthase [Chitinophagales bacterium]